MRGRKGYLLYGPQDPDTAHSLELAGLAVQLGCHHWDNSQLVRPSFDEGQRRVEPPIGRSMPLLNFPSPSEVLRHGLSRREPVPNLGFDAAFVMNLSTLRNLLL